VEVKKMMPKKMLVVVERGTKMILKLKLLTFLSFWLLIIPWSQVFGQGSITGTVNNSDMSIPADSELTFWGFLDDTDEEIRTELSDGAGCQNGYWWDDFQNYLTEAPGDPYDYLFSNLVNGKFHHLEGLIPNNSYQEENIVLSSASNPSKPTGVKATVTSPSRVVVSWNKVAGITYHVYRRYASINGSLFRLDDPSGSLANPGVSDSFFVDTSVDGVSSFTYMVIGENASGNYTPHSDEATATVPTVLPPSPIHPPNDTTLQISNPDLVILNGIDGLGRELFHLFEVDTTIRFSSANLQQSTPLAVEYLTDSTTLWTVPQELDIGTYYWRAYAYTNTIPSDTSDPSEVFSFMIASTDVMDTAYQLTLESPLRDDTVPTLRPTLVARLVFGSLEMNFLSCQFEVSADPHFSNNLLSSERITFSTDRTARWEVTQDLKQSARFYWRAKLYLQDRVVDVTETSTIFTGSIHVFPNPFKPSLGHSHVTFRNIPLNSTIRITTISGDLVKTFEGTDQTDVVWDVKNEDQKDLASGVYLYWVSHGGEVISGKIFVIR
jgi:hypothetical protein